MTYWNIFVKFSRYLQEVEQREEGGTPAIVESVRAGMVFQLKDAVGVTSIQERDEQLCRLELTSVELTHS